MLAPLDLFQKITANGRGRFLGRGMRCRRTHKVMHRTEQAALKALASVNIPTLDIYRCAECQHWHLGNYSRAVSDFDRQAKIDRLLGAEYDKKPRVVRG